MATPPRKKSPKSSEQKVYGYRVCELIWERRPKDIIRVYVLKSQAKIFADLIQWCVENHIAYHAVSSEEMETIAEAKHHEGICLLVRQPTPIRFEEWINRRFRRRCNLIYLDQVSNPHNVGALFRSAAHFGIDGILAERSTLPRIPPSTTRTAEGGTELVPFIPVDNGKLAITELKKVGFTVASTSSHNGENVFGVKLPTKLILVMGSEAKGVSPEIVSLSDLALQIPGTGHMESLNVSVSAGVLMGEIWRQAGTLVGAMQIP